jgi:hypothetical protein
VKGYNALLPNKRRIDEGRRNDFRLDISITQVRESLKVIHTNHGGPNINIYGQNTNLYQGCPQVLNRKDDRAQAYTIQKLLAEGKIS